MQISVFFHIICIRLCTPKQHGWNNMVWDPEYCYVANEEVVVFAKNSACLKLFHHGNDLLHTSVRLLISSEKKMVPHQNLVPKQIEEGQARLLSSFMSSETNTWIHGLKLVDPVYREREAKFWLSTFIIVSVIWPRYPYPSSLIHVRRLVAFRW
jgi:hypothetical protein